MNEMTKVSSEDTLANAVGDTTVACTFYEDWRTGNQTEIIIHGTETVATSFPTFTELANAAGLDLQVVDQ